MKHKSIKLISFLLLFIPSVLFAQEVGASPFSGLDIETILKPTGFTSTINLLVALSSIGLIPFFLISTTSFLRTVIVLSMIRQAIGTQSSPPNPIIIALAMFMTIFVMTPTWNEVNESAVKPYKAGKISQNEAIELGAKPFRNFMLKFIRDKDLALFLEFSQMKSVNDYENVPIFVLIPSFVISELKTAFQIGFLLFIPFVVIDLIVSNILLSLGMFMLSPAMISLPFKILLFVLTDGWNLIIRGLLISFQ
ncbi:flagellar type III secretion system pore protein FliP [bacterium]|jgi:flagellar biosynthesis protein FliP|nr:flagellar type III secretion system pore protein FliP [bacterium]